jgi:hypothetical protein
MRDRNRVDVASLVAGLVITALGTLLLLDRVETIDLRFGWLWPALAAAVGAILLASGLTRGRR